MFCGYFQFSSFFFGFSWVLCFVFVSVGADRTRRRTPSGVDAAAVVQREIF